MSLRAQPALECLNRGTRSPVVSVMAMPLDSGSSRRGRDVRNDEMLVTPGPACPRMLESGDPESSRICINRDRFTRFMVRDDNCYWIPDRGPSASGMTKQCPSTLSLPRRSYATGITKTGHSGRRPGVQSPLLYKCRWIPAHHVHGVMSGMTA